MCVNHVEEKVSYDLTFKFKAVKRTEETTKEVAAREFKVDPRRIREYSLINAGLD